MIANASPNRRTRIVTLLVLISLSTLVAATPWAEPLRRVIRPQLPAFIVILAGVSALAQVVVAVGDSWSRKGGRRSAALPLSLAASALCMALAFLPGAWRDGRSLYALVGAALFALIAAALQHRAGKRPEL